MADGKRYANHRKDLLSTFLVSKKTKWNGEKPHKQIKTPPKFQPTVHPPPSFARFCETRISSPKQVCNIFAPPHKRHNFEDARAIKGREGACPSCARVLEVAPYKPEEKKSLALQNLYDGDCLVYKIKFCEHNLI